MLLIGKKFEIFPKNNKYGFISESSGLNWYIFVAFTNIKTQVSIIMKIQINDLNLKKLAEYLNSTVIVVSSNPVVGPSPQTNISFFKSSLCTDELLSTPKITTFLYQLKPRHKKSEQESNSISYPE